MSCYVYLRLPAAVADLITYVALLLLAVDIPKACSLSKRSLCMQHQNYAYWFRGILLFDSPVPSFFSNISNFFSRYFSLSKTSWSCSVYRLGCRHPEAAVCWSTKWANVFGVMSNKGFSSWP